MQSGNLTILLESYRVDKTASTMTVRCKEAMAQWLPQSQEGSTTSDKGKELFHGWVVSRGSDSGINSCISCNIYWTDVYVYKWCCFVGDGDGLQCLLHSIFTCIHSCSDFRWLLLQYGLQPSTKSNTATCLCLVVASVVEKRHHVPDSFESGCQRGTMALGQWHSTRVCTCLEQQVFVFKKVV